MLEISPKLGALFSDVKNVGTKRSGSAILYIRGSQSRKGLKGISVSNVTCDEFDEMPEHTIPMAQERMSGQLRKCLALISTPRFPGKGINREFLDTTQEHYYFPCPLCGRRIELLHENLVVTGDDIHDPDLEKCHVICGECKGVLFRNNPDKVEFAEQKADLLKNAEWEATAHKDFQVRGFYINQLYSPTIQPLELATTWLKALTNKSAEQEYHNSKMGDAHEVEGARLSTDVIKRCYAKNGRVKGYQNTNTLVTMGVDVGRWMHIEIAAWYFKRLSNDLNLSANCSVLYEGKRATFEEIAQLMREYQIFMAVIDVQPETRGALSLAKRFPGHIKLCRYAKNIADKTIDGSVIDKEKYIVNVDRTSWLDLSLGRFANQTIVIPTDTSLEYMSHLQNIGRVYEEDKDGNQVGRYVSNGDDHFAHARNYNEIALPLAAAFQSNSDIGAFL